MKRNWPNIFESNGYWIVDGRRYLKGLRTGKREYFDTEARAIGRADMLRMEILGKTDESIALSLKEQADARHAIDLLKPHNRSLLEAALFFQKHLDKKDVPVISLSSAICEWLNCKRLMLECGDIEERTYQTLQYRINIFKNFFPKASIQELTHEILLTFFRNPNYSAQTRANIKAVVSEFLLWCRHAKKWVTENPCEQIEIKIKDREVEILTPALAKSLLASAFACPWPQEFVPYVGLGLFAGVRPSELQGLEWKEIDFSTKHIRIKSEEIRYIPIEKRIENILREFKSHGMVINSNFRKRWDFVRTSAGFCLEESAKGNVVRYPADGMRHSFGSYWLALHKDRPRLAELMGNSIAVIKRHYRKAITENEAKDFWKLLDSPQLYTS